MSLIGVEFSKDALHPGRVSSVLLWFNEYATPREVIYGYFCACVFQSLLASDSASKAAEGSSSREAAQQHVRSTYKRMEALTEQWWESLSEVLVMHGWRFDVAFLDDKDRRIRIQ